MDSVNPVILLAIGTIAGIGLGMMMSEQREPQAAMHDAQEHEPEEQSEVDLSTEQ